MTSDALIDYKQFNHFKKQFEREKLADLVFPNPSSKSKVVFNTAASVVVGGIWSMGYKKLYKVTAKFPYKVLGLISAYSLTYNLSKEFSNGYLYNNLHLNNTGVSNLFAGILTTAIFLPIGLRGALEIPNLYYKLCLHYFVVNIYWDLYIVITRKRLLENQLHSVGNLSSN